MNSPAALNLFLSSLIGIFIVACNASTPSPTVIPSSVVTSTPILRQELIPSPTDIQLPFNPEVKNNGYCKPPSAILPVSDNNDISEDEIVNELIKVWLRRYTDPNAPLFCHIDGYRIDKVYYDLSILSGPLEPRGDFMRVVLFSVKLIQIPSDWMSFSGKLDQENWLHLSQPVAVTKTNDGYKMQFAYP
jgi:hypothetical protein